MSKKYTLTQDRDDDGIRGTLARHFVAFIVLIGVMIAIVALVVSAFIFGVAHQTPRVALRASAGQTTIAAYTDLLVTPVHIVMLSPDTACTYISGPTSAKLDNTVMQFYKLRCGGSTVDVNAIWVERR